MSKDGGITERARRSITELLDWCLELEYGYIIKYATLVDQLRNTPTVHDPDNTLHRSLETLGRKSANHFRWTSQLISDLGGELQWHLEAMDEVADQPSTLLAHFEKEKIAQSLFRLAKGSG